MTFLPSSKKNILVLSSGFSVFISLLLLLLKVYVSVSFLPDISGSEGSTILPIQRFLAGLPIYVNPEETPFLISQYTPIYFVLVSSFAKLLQIAPDEVHKVFIISRFASITLSILGSCLLGFFLYKKAKVEKWTSILAASFVFQILSFWFLTSSRPDSLVFFLTVMYVAVIYRAIQHDKQDNIWWYVAIFIAVTAFFVKQNAAIHSLSIAAFLMIRRQWMPLVKITALGIVFFVLYLLLLPISSLQLFFMNIVGGVSNSVSWAWFYDWTLQRLLFQFALVLTLAIIVVSKSIGNFENRFLQFLSVCNITFFCFATMISFKIGAGVGYFQDFLVMAVVMIVLFFSQNEVKAKLQVPFLPSFFSIYMSLVAIHCLLFVYMNYTSIALESFKSQYLQQANVSVYLKNDLKLADDQLVYITESQNFNGNYLKHFLYKNTIAPFSDIVYLGKQNGTFDYSQFDALVRENKIKYVITQIDQKPTTILGHSFDKAKKVKTIDSYDIYQNY